jgi:hypothetical protein
MKKTVLTCRAPDRDVPKIVCGYPLPCPHHTAIVDVATDEVAIPVRIGAKAAVRVLEIADAMKKERDPR